MAKTKFTKAWIIQNGIPIVESDVQCLQTDL